MIHAGAPGRFSQADIPAINQAFLDMGVESLLGKDAPAWSLAMKSLMDPALDRRFTGLVFEALPDFFKKAGLGLGEPILMGGSTLALVACWLDQDKLRAAVGDFVNLDQIDSGGRHLVSMRVQMCTSAA